MQGIIDRIEGDILVIEVEGKMYNFKSDTLENEYKEGDVVDVKFSGENIVAIEKNIASTQKRKEYIESITKDMWE